MFRKKRGSLHMGMRIDNAAGLLAAIYVNSKSKKGGYRVHDFSFHADEPEISLGDAMERWK